MPSSTITLYTSRPGFGMPDTSPFVIKTEVQLKMAGLSYRRESAIPPQAPKGKLPYLIDGAEVIADSTFIRAHIERKYAIDLDDGLDKSQRAQAWAIERLLEDHLYFAMVWFRWIVPENFAKGPARFADVVPEAQREQMRREIQARKDADLRSHGIGRHTPEEIAFLGGRSIDAVAQLLGDRFHFMGDTPSSVDAAALGVLASVLTPHFDTPLRKAVLGHANLMAYVQRMMQRYYPDHAWAPEPVAEAV
jgi:glutathione S-transferase